MAEFAVFEMLRCNTEHLEIRKIYICKIMTFTHGPHTSMMDSGIIQKTHTHTHVYDTLLCPVSLRLNRAAHSLVDFHWTGKADWSAGGERGDISRCGIRAARLPRMQRGLCLKVLRPAARSKLTVYLCGAGGYQGLSQWTQAHSAAELS